MRATPPAPLVDRQATPAGTVFSVDAGLRGTERAS